MKRRAALCAALVLAAVPLPASACKGDPAGEADAILDASTICPEHFPADAPRFEDYPASRYAGPVAPVRWRADPQARLYRSMLQQAARGQRPNFAGRFIMVHWGCGSGCVSNKIIDARSGRVFHPAGAESNAVMNIHGSFFDTGGTLRYRPDSRLFILIGEPEEDARRRGISFFEWTGSRMRLLRHVPVP